MKEKDLLDKINRETALTINEIKQMVIRDFGDYNFNNLIHFSESIGVTPKELSSKEIREIVLNNPHIPIWAITGEEPPFYALSESEYIKKYRITDIEEMERYHEYRHAWLNERPEY